MKHIDKRVALVTGANKGIGHEVARGLASSGMIVLLGARSAELGVTAATALKSQGLDVRFIEIDVVRPATLAAAAKLIGAEFGRLDD